MNELQTLLNEGRFDEASALADSLLRDAHAHGPTELLEAARRVLAWRGFFPNSAQALASVAYFTSTYELLKSLAGPDAAMTLAAADNLAGVLASVDRLAEAIPLKERVHSGAIRLYPPDDPRYLAVRDGLAFLYRRAGDADRANDLYRQTGICTHLVPVEHLLREGGLHPESCGRPWSDNCHIWVFFDRVLDCEALMRTLALDPCVRIHDHRGTHDGSERGLFCTVHQDAVVGRHPLDAGSTPGFP